MGTFTGIYYTLCRITEKATQMKVTVYLKKSSPEASNICFRVRDKNVDIKVVSPLEVQDKYWDSDTLSYKRTTAVPAAEQKRLPEQIASIIERAEKTFTDKADSRWMRQVIEDVLYPARAFERNHPTCSPVSTSIWRSLTVRREQRSISSASSAR